MKLRVMGDAASAAPPEDALFYPGGRRSRRGKFFTFVAAMLLLLMACAPAGIKLAANVRYYTMVHDPSYIASHGRWTTIDLPEDLQVNAIHAAVLPTGKVLIIAGSGNQRSQFEAGTFRSLLYDPKTGSARLIETPSDMFCGGHAFLPDGRLLVAGGTQRYEFLDGSVTNAGGPVYLQNANPAAGVSLPAGMARDGVSALPGGTQLLGPNGVNYVTAEAVELPPATVTKVGKGKRAHTVVTPARKKVYVVGLTGGQPGVLTNAGQAFSISGRPDLDPKLVTATSAGPINLDKQDYLGSKLTYIFDPVAERYVRVGDMNHDRWYATLLKQASGTVLAISGLDGTGQVLDGQVEAFDPANNNWRELPNKHYLPTYPAVFQTERPGWLFFTGSSSGYGPATKGRQPGFWNIDSGAFGQHPDGTPAGPGEDPAMGLRASDMLETSASGWAGPVNNQTLMVVGGGGTGESNQSTARIDLIDLRGPAPHYTAGPMLPQGGLRYPLLATLPNGQTLITNGSADYRGRGDSDVLAANLYDPIGNRLEEAAPPEVGRNYHSEAVLLPSGQVLTMGSDPLFGNKEGTKAGTFEHRLEIYEPPYLFDSQGQPSVRPSILDGPDSIKLGDTAAFAIGSSDPTRTKAPHIAKARLLAPAAVTHFMDVNQRLVELGVQQDSNTGTVHVSVPAQGTLVPPGRYMLFVVDDNGVPSVAKWVSVS